MGTDDDELIPRGPFLRLLDHPFLFALVLAVVLGLAGSVGLLGGRYGPQLVPRGSVGFAYGATLGLVGGVSSPSSAGASRRASSPQRSRSSSSRSRSRSGDIID